MAQEWYVRINGAERGPITGSALKRLAAAGELKPDDAIRQSTSEKWVPARKVKGLFTSDREQRTETPEPKRELSESFGIPPKILREYVVFPLSKTKKGITLLAEQPSEDLRDRLQFVLNAPIQLVAAERSEILEQIELCCGKSSAVPIPSQSPIAAQSGVSMMLLSVDEVARVDAEMGEMHLSCPQCGHCERVNDVGKWMLNQGQNVFARFTCPACQHVFDGAAHLRSGSGPVSAPAPTVVLISPAEGADRSPVPKKTGPGFWTRLARPFAISRYASKIAAKVRDTHPQRASGLYDHEDYLRQLGEEIHSLYGFQGMVDVFNSVKQRKGSGPMSELNRIWNRVGDWQA